VKHHEKIVPGNGSPPFQPIASDGLKYVAVHFSRWMPCAASVSGSGSDAGTLIRPPQLRSCGSMWVTVRRLMLPRSCVHADKLVGASWIAEKLIERCQLRLA